MVSADVPPQDGETAEQAQAREAANAEHARHRQAEAAQANQHATVQANPNVQANAQGNQLPNNGADGAPPAGQPAQRHEDPPRHRIHARDLQRDFKEAGHEVYNSPQANLGAALAGLGQLEDTPTMCRAIAHLCVATTQVEERSQGYTQ